MVPSSVFVIRYQIMCNGFRHSHKETTMVGIMSLTYWLQQGRIQAGGELGVRTPPDYIKYKYKMTHVLKRLYAKIALSFDYSAGNDQDNDLSQH